jgi:signal transduction histidine kinase
MANEFKAENERFKLLNSMPDGVYIVNKDFEIDYVNPVIQQEFGTVNKRKCYEYLHDRKSPCPWCNNEEVFAGKTIRWEWHSNKNNKTYDLLDAPVKNDDGTISKLELFRDITELKEAQKKIFDLAKFPSENPNPVFRVDDRLNILYSNEPGKQLLKKFGLKSNKIPKSLAEKIYSSIEKNKDDLSIMELDIGRSTYEFSIIPVKGSGYFNVYGKDVTEVKKAQRSKMRLFRSRIQNVERKKLAGELHDTVTQTLFTSKLLSETALKLYKKDPDKALKNIKKVKDLNNAALLEARILLYELMPQKIAQVSLADLIKRLVEAVTLKSNIRFDVKVKGDYRLSYKVLHNFYRIAQESINNIVKHSKASQVKIELELMPSKPKLIVSDNGVGFDIGDRLSKRSFGLNIMNERAKDIGASLEVISSPGKGTKIKLTGK